MRLNFTRTHGRSERGKRCHGQRPKPKGKIVTLIGAMCITGVIASLMFEGGTNTETFLFFVREILVPALWKGFRCCCFYFHCFSSAERPSWLFP